jgi:hypothetical protein
MPSGVSQGVAAPPAAATGAEAKSILAKSGMRDIDDPLEPSAP